MLQGSVTNWLVNLKSGDSGAAQKLWERYFERLVRLAERRLRNMPAKAVDQEDIALSAFAAFCRSIEHGRYPDLGSRDYLWNLLVEITENKANDAWRRESAAKRGRGEVRCQADLGNDRVTGKDMMEQIADSAPTPEFTAQITEELRGYFQDIENYDDEKKTLQRIALWKLQGYSNREMVDLAAGPDTKLSLRSIERKVKLIRDILGRRLEQ